jgi:hypothetical protein
MTDLGILTFSAQIAVDSRGLARIGAERLSAECGLTYAWTFALKCFEDL